MSHDEKPEEQTFKHIPVLFDESVKALKISGDVLSNFAEKDFIPCIIDCTLGGGGHAKALLLSAESEISNREKNNSEAEPTKQLASSFPVTFIGFDQDLQAFNHTSSILNGVAPAIKKFFFNENFANLESRLKEAPKNSKILTLLADLGVSSPQIDSAERGFSFNLDGPIDMRMSQSSSLTAGHVLETFSESELKQIFRDYGEEPKAGKVAAAICRDRLSNKLPTTTLALAQYLEKVLSYGKSRNHPATKIFQALRICVNNELGSIHQLLQIIPSFVYHGTKVGLITFHSLEDRIVKKYFRAWEAGFTSLKLHEESQNNKFFSHTLNNISLGKELPRGGIEPSEKETSCNRRSRSARLRVFQFH